jgi:hypothetical protein
MGKQTSETKKIFLLLAIILLIVAWILYLVGWGFLSPIFLVLSIMSYFGMSLLES